MRKSFEDQRLHISDAWKSKRKFRFNAMTTGFFSAERFVQTKYYNESEAEYERIQVALSRSLPAQDAFEEELVKQIAYDFYSLQRATRFERAVIKKKVEETVRDQFKNDSVLINCDMELRNLDDNIESLEHKLQGLAKLPIDPAALNALSATATSGKDNHLAFLADCFMIQLTPSERFVAEQEMQQMGAANYFKQKRGVPLGVLVTKLRPAVQLVLDARIELRDEVRRIRKQRLRAVKKEAERNALYCPLLSTEDLDKLERFTKMHMRKFDSEVELYKTIRSISKSNARVAAPFQVQENNCDSDAPETPVAPAVDNGVNIDPLPHASAEELTQKR